MHNLLQKCRLCLEGLADKEGLPIADELLQEKMRILLDFEIMPALSWLPTNACGNCAGTIDSFIAFRQKVRTNQDYLYSLKVEEGPNGTVGLSDDVKTGFSGNINELPAISAPSNCLEVIYNPVKEIDEETHLINPTTDEALVNEEVVVKREAAGDEDSVRSSLIFQSDDADFNDPLGDQQKKKTEKVKRCRPPREHCRARLSAADTDRKKRRQASEEDEQRLKNFYHLNCEVCTKVSNSFSDLLAHYRTEHNTGGFVRCCDRTFKKKCLALEHLEVHLGTIRCDICSKTYNSVDTLQLHKLQQHSGPEAKPFKCDKCHQSFPKAYLLKSHLKRHKQEPCPTCGKMLSNQGALKMHIAMIHKKTPNLICDICGKEMTTKQTMERHMNMHMGLETVERVQCEQCQKWFKGIYVLQRHVKHVHTEQGQIFQCDICLQKYPNTRALSHHKQRVHVEEKFSCEFCGKRFKRKIYLREHVASHTGQPLYSCNLCTATFNSSGNLYAHRRKSHVGAGRGSRNSSGEPTVRKPVRNQGEPIT